MENSAILSRMDVMDKRVVTAYAKANMKAQKAARYFHISANGLYYRLNKVYEKTGFNPRDFHDLCRLVTAIEEERNEYDE